MGAIGHVQASGGIVSFYNLLTQTKSRMQAAVLLTTSCIPRQVIHLAAVLAALDIPAPRMIQKFSTEEDVYVLAD